MEAVVYFAPLFLLLTAITSSIQGDKLVLLWVLLFIGWGVGFPAACIYHDHHTDLVNQAEWRERRD